MRLLSSIVGALLAASVLTGCGDGSSGQEVEADLTITIEGDRVEPNAQPLEASAGEPIRIHIRSDRSGELHVHAAPEQTIEFEAGTSTEDLVVDTPGLVHIEEHRSGVAVARVDVT